MFDLVIFMFKINKGMTPQSVNNMFNNISDQLYIYIYIIRDSPSLETFKIKISRIALMSRQRHLLFLAPSLFSIPFYSLLLVLGFF